MSRRSRKRSIILGGLVGCLMAAGIALGFYLTYSGVSSPGNPYPAGVGGTGGAGSQTAAISVGMNDYPFASASGGGSCSTTNLGVGCSGTITNVFDEDLNPTAQETLASIQPVISIGATGVTGVAGPNGPCLSSYFQFNWPAGFNPNSPGQGALQPGAGYSSLAQNASLTFDNLPNTNESGCASDGPGGTAEPVIVTFTGTSSP